MSSGMGSLAGMQPYNYTAPDGRVTSFQIMGGEAQVVQIDLAPGDSASSEPGALCYMSAGVETDTTADGGLLTALQRWIAGESFFLNTFTNKGEGPAYIAFAAPTMSRIVHLDLANLGGSMLCQQDAYLCSLGKVEVSSAVQQRLSAGFFGGEGFILQKLEGQGLAFITATGTIVQRVLAEGETMVVDAGCMVAFSPSVDYQVQYVGSVKRAIFGGEGLFYARLKGPGTLVLQSLPAGRYARRMLLAARGVRSEEGRGMLGRCHHWLLAVCVTFVMAVVPLLLIMFQEALLLRLDNFEDELWGAAGAGAGAAGAEGGQGGRQPGGANWRQVEL